MTAGTAAGEDKGLDQQIRPITSFIILGDELSATGNKGAAIPTLTQEPVSYPLPTSTQSMGSIDGHSNGDTAPAATGRVPLPNRLLSIRDDDNLHHFGILKSHHELLESLADVKFVCIGGSLSRMKMYAERFANENPPVKCSTNLSQSDRYGMWKTGQVLWVNHGMGTPSLSIMLSELMKLLHYSHCTNVRIIRIGTCGGIGVEPGTVVVTTGALNGLLQPKHIQYIAGRKVERDAIVDPTLSSQLLAAAERLHIPTVTGLTLCADDFYEGQMRLDGLFCDYGHEEKQQFLNRLQEMGVKNIEMECTCFAAFTHRLGIQGAIICVALLDRLEGDQIHLSPEEYAKCEIRPFMVTSQFIRESLLQNGL